LKSAAVRLVPNKLKAWWQRVHKTPIDSRVRATEKVPSSHHGPYWKLQQAFSALANGLDGRAELQHAVRAWRSLAEDVDRPLMVPVMGHFKAGKSTFLNALLGNELLCSDVLPATAAVTVLRYGSEPRLRAFFADRGPKDYPFEKLRDISAEGDREWARLREQLSHIEVILPNARLKQVTLVDTPGLNSVHGLHTRVTKDFIERADAIIWLFACPQVGTKTELDEIRKLPDGCRPYAVINQIDLLDPDEQPVDEFLGDVARRLGDSVRYPIGVSARLALSGLDGGGKDALAASRWRDFVHVLDGQILAGSADRKAIRIVERIEAALDLVLAFAESKHEEIRNAALALRQGEEYESNVRGRIEDLARLARAWQESPASDSADLIVAAAALGDDVDQCAALNQRREAMVGVLDGVATEAEQLTQEEERLKSRIQEFQRRLAGHNARVEKYMHSGLFGGPPVFGRMFDGGKRDRLEAEELALQGESAELDSSASVHDSEVALFKSRLARVKQECDEFVREVYAAIIRSTKALEHSLEHRDESRQEAHTKIKEYMWVGGVLRGLLENAIPTLEQGLSQFATASKPCEQRLGTISERLRKLRLCSDAIHHELQISNAVAAPSPPRGRISSELEREQQMSLARIKESISSPETTEHHAHRYSGPQSLDQAIS
jgi:GTPase SAR1 family protein